MITGNLESLGRDEAAELVKRHSGRVTGSVSGKTTFLLVGQDSGKKKTDMVGQLSATMDIASAICVCSKYNSRSAAWELSSGQTPLEGTGKRVNDLGLW